MRGRERERERTDRGGGRPSSQGLVPKPLSKQASKQYRERKRENEVLAVCGVGSYKTPVISPITA